MKIGIHDYYYDTDWDLTPTERYAIYHDAGFAGVDFNTSRTQIPFYTEPESRMRELITGIRAQIEGQGMIVHQVHGPWCWPPVKDETPEGRILRAEEMKRSILIASLLGSKYWAVHPIMPHRVRDLQQGNEESTWALNKEFMSWLLEYARQLDVTICLENLPFPHFSMAKPEKVLQFVKEMNDPHFKVCLDTGHVAVFPELDVAQQVRLLGDELRVLHVHDNGGEKDEHLHPGKGIIDWKRFAQALKDIGFSGVFSLETSPAVGLAEPEFRRETQELAQIARQLANEITH